MDDILNTWLDYGPADALHELQARSMKERNEMAAKAQQFADWLALENSRAING